MRCVAFLHLSMSCLEISTLMLVCEVITDFMFMFALPRVDAMVPKIPGTLPTFFSGKLDYGYIVSERNALYHTVGYARISRDNCVGPSCELNVFML